ncbi:MAG: DsbA family protein [Magnetococcus sp. WYHC-3]
MSLRKMVLTGLLAVATLLAAHHVQAADPVVASAGALQITRSQVDTALTAELFTLEMKMFELRQAKAIQLLNKALVDAEAAKVGKPVHRFLQEKIFDHVPAVTDADVAAFKAENAEQVGKIKQALESRNQGHMLDGMIRSRLGEARLRESDAKLKNALWEKAGAKLMLKPPEAPVTPVKGPMDLSQGPAKAQVTIVLFTDFQNPVSRQSYELMRQLQQANPDKSRWVIKHFPMPSSPLAPKAAEASMCAHQQGQFWPYADALMAKEEHLTPEGLKALARSLKLDAARFDTCLEKDQQFERVKDDLDEGYRLGVNQSPTFFINGRRTGALPLQVLKKAIEMAATEKRK